MQHIINPAQKPEPVSNLASKGQVYQLNKIKILFS